MDAGNLSELQVNDAHQIIRVTEIHKRMSC